MHTKLKRAPGLYLTGFMGSGKSTIAQVLADRLGWEFVDLDAEIEGMHQDTVARIFDTLGEPGFRRLETDMLKAVVRKVERGMPAVVALGGGTFVQPANFALLEDHGISIWLDCSFETIQARIEDPASRPLARDEETFKKLYEERREAYGQAHFKVDANCSVERAVELILQLPIWK
jgi:shikimate kinase